MLVLFSLFDKHINSNKFQVYLWCRRCLLTTSCFSGFCYLNWKCHSAWWANSLSQRKHKMMHIKSWTEKIKLIFALTTVCFVRTSTLVSNCGKVKSQRTNRQTNKQSSIFSIWCWTRCANIVSVSQSDSDVETCWICICLDMLLWLPVARLPCIS